jgi:nicotinamide-nucleotide adenylyltransferase
LALINATIPSKTSVDEDYDARLLLLSVKNVDKTLKATDATYIQRLEMMRLMAGHVLPPSSLTSEKANVAVGIISEPTFVGKSKTLLSFLHHRLTSIPTSAPTTTSTRHNLSLELSFIVGMDTLERLVAPRYYGSEDAMMTSLHQFLSPQEENCIVVCARRNLQPSTSGTAEVDSERNLRSAKEFIDTGRIKLMDIGTDESTFSSTVVRNTVKQLGVSEEGKRVWGRYLLPNVMDYIASEGLYVA